MKLKILLFLALLSICTSKIISDVNLDISAQLDLQAQSIKTLSDFLDLAQMQDPNLSSIDIQSILGQATKRSTSKAPISQQDKQRLERIRSSSQIMSKTSASEPTKLFDQICRQFNIPNNLSSKETFKGLSQLQHQRLIKGLKNMIVSDKGAPNSRLLAWLQYSKKIKIWFISFWITIFVWVPECTWYWIVIAYILGGKCIP